MSGAIRRTRRRRSSSGYARVLDGEAARTVLTAAGMETGHPVAVRRSALTAVADGSLAGVVRAARITPQQVRLEVDVDGVGTVDAVAPLDVHPRPGDRIGLAVDRNRLAIVGRSAASARGRATT